MAESYFLFLDVAFVSWDISSDFLNQASHILQIQYTVKERPFNLRERIF
jgi:hypothetical protein